MGSSTMISKPQHHRVPYTYFVVALLIFVTQIGCYTLRPAHSYNPQHHRARIITVDEPEWVQEPTPWAWVVTGGAGLAAGYAGYRINYLKFAGDTQNVRVGPIASGLISGGLTFVGSYFLVKLLNPHPQVTEQNVRTWVEKLDEDLIYISHTSTYYVGHSRAYDGVASVTMVQKDGEARVRLWSDDAAEAYITAFPHSPYIATKVLEAKSAISRESLPKLAEMVVDKQTREAIQNEYVNRSSSITECIEAARRYPELRSVAEQKAAPMVTYFSTAREYASEFSTGVYTHSVVRNLVASIDYLNVKGLTSIFPQEAFETDVMAAYLLKVDQIQECAEVAGKFPLHRLLADSLAATIAIKHGKESEYLKYFADGLHTSRFRQVGLDRVRAQIAKARDTYDCLFLLRTTPPEYRDEILSGAVSIAYSLTDCLSFFDVFRYDDPSPHATRMRTIFSKAIDDSIRYIEARAGAMERHMKRLENGAESARSDVASVANEIDYTFERLRRSEEYMTPKQYARWQKVLDNIVRLGNKAKRFQR